jgi:hypothetical protein
MLRRNAPLHKRRLLMFPRGSGRRCRAPSKHAGSAPRNMDHAGATGPSESSCRRPVAFLPNPLLPIPNPLRSNPHRTWISWRHPPRPGAPSPPVTPPSPISVAPIWVGQGAARPNIYAAANVAGATETAPPEMTSSAVSRPCRRDARDHQAAKHSHERHNSSVAHVVVVVQKTSAT